jgi:hypothetical protein
MSLPATDNFNGTEFTELPTWNAGWSAQEGSMQIIGTPSSAGTAGGKTVGGGNMCSVRWTGDSFNSDHYSQAKYVSNNYPGIMVRLQSGSSSGYIYFVSIGNLYRYDSGAITDLGVSGPICGIGDIGRLEMSGSTMSASKNGGSPTNKTDATYSGGGAGIGSFSASGQVDDWEGGNLASAPFPPFDLVTSQNHPVGCPAWLQMMVGVKLWAKALAFVIRTSPLIPRFQLIHRSSYGAQHAAIA